MPRAIEAIRRSAGERNFVGPAVSRNMALMSGLDTAADGASGLPQVTRFAPSPTGELHLGNARTALFNFLLARRAGGRLLLRIEDTDTERSQEAHTAALSADLRWLGIDWDAGPDREDERGPYRQSQRSALYARFFDRLEGTQSLLPHNIGDFAIHRADGSAAFFFCNAVDDACMGVTHVLRGEDHLTNTPRQLLILEALGLPAPSYGHVSLIVGHDGAPLSKRHGATSVREYRERGYRPEAMANHLFRLGHSTSEH